MKTYNDELYHHGVLGMKWGVHKHKYANKKINTKKDSFVLKKDHLFIDPRIMPKMAIKRVTHLPHLKPKMLKVTL